MTTTQPPYYATNFDTHSLSSTTPIGTTVGREASTADPQTGPAPTTAGPHRADMANRLDPRIDSDLNNRAQYAPGTTMSGNVHPGTTQNVSNPDSVNEGPHSSTLYNKLDPRVDSKTGNMTTKTTNQSGTGASRAPTDTSGLGVTQGSSTGSSGAPGVQDTPSYRSAYDPSGTGYNPSTGTGYSTAAPGYSTQGQDYRAEYAPSTVDKKEPAGAAEPKESIQSQESAGRSKRTSDQIGQGVKSTIAGIHGSGESLRGTLNSAVDKAFGSRESAAKNDAIATDGEREVKTGNLQHHRSEGRR